MPAPSQTRSRCSAGRPRPRSSPPPRRRAQQARGQLCPSSVWARHEYRSCHPRAEASRSVGSSRVRPDELERRLRKRLDALGLAPRAELLHVLMLSDLERAERIGELETSAIACLAARYAGIPGHANEGHCVGPVTPVILRTVIRPGLYVRPVTTVLITKIAELLGVSHPRTSVIVGQPGFPAPVDREGQSRLWDRREVTARGERWRREKPLGVCRTAV